MADHSEKQYLNNYSLEKYERPSVTSDIVIFTIWEEQGDNRRKMAESRLAVLLIRRNEHPYKNCWALPGGFLCSNETIEECAIRELKEETGLGRAKLVPIGAFSKPGRDPRGWIVSNAFMAPVYRNDTHIHGGTDAAEAAWFTFDAQFCETDGSWRLRLESCEREQQVILNAEILQKTGITGLTEYEVKSSDGIAFDHPQILMQAYSSLKKHLVSDGIAYDFLPTQFTIMQLQKVHELILKQPLLAANFRRKISDEIEETGQMLEGKAFRPAMLYRYKQ